MANQPTDDVTTLRTRDERTRGGVALFLLSAAFVLCHLDVLRLLVFQWSSNDVYSYAFLIPPISGYICWTKRHAIARALGPASYWLGVPTMLLGVAIAAIGKIGGFATLQELSLLVTLLGLVLLFGATRLLGVVWLPLAYLLFTVPVWDLLTERLHLPFQLLSARIGEVILALLRVPSYRAGTVLQLPTVTLEVARACSGVNYLISIVAVAVPYAYFSVARPLRRVAVVATAILVAIFSNGLRVAFIGSLQYYGFSDHADLHGPNHVLQGMFVAVVGYGALFVSAWLLRERTRPSVQEDQPAAVRPATAWGRPVVVALALMCAGTLLRLSWDIQPVALGAARFPDQVGCWSSTPGSVESSAVRAANPDAELSLAYHCPGVGTVHVYVGYFAAQKPGRKLVGEGGAELPAGATRTLLGAADGRGAEVGEAEMAGAGAGRRYVLAWYDLNGSVTPSAYLAKVILVREAVIRRRSSGAVVALTLDDAFALPSERARAELRRFGGDLLPVVQRALWAER